MGWQSAWIGSSPSAGVAFGGDAGEVLLTTPAGERRLRLGAAPVMGIVDSPAWDRITTVSPTGVVNVHTRYGHLIGTIHPETPAQPRNLDPPLTFRVAPEALDDFALVPGGSVEVTGVDAEDVVPVVDALGAGGASASATFIHGDATCSADERYVLVPGRAGLHIDVAGATVVSRPDTDVRAAMSPDGRWIAALCFE